MKFGPVPPKAPKQDSTKILKIASRWQRACDAHNRWAEGAKRAVDFFEGRQWTEEQLAKMKGRPTLKFNVIAPLVRLILGYHRSHRTDIVFNPSQDQLASEQTSEVLTRVEKAISQFSKQEFVDTEVFLDGIIANRGFFDTRLDFEDNDLGEIKRKAVDPFSVKLDPDGDTYDLNESSSYFCIDKWVSCDEVEGAFGNGVADLIRPFTMGTTPLAPLSSFMVDEEITPVRFFSGREDMQNEWWDQFYSMAGDFVDTYRKTIRLVETQYKVTEIRDVFIDLETGDRQVIPLEWDQQRIQKCIDWAAHINNPLMVQRRSVERVHHTIVAGDLILYDAPSLYDKFTLTGYFPYFRRGFARGMVEDLIDPQLEKNKRRNAEIEIVSKTANGGWMYHEDALDPDQERKLQKFGAQPGVQIKYKGEVAPQLIEPSGPALKHERLEKAADQDMRTISGVNESALGELDRVQSGRAIEARQRQAVLAVQIYMDNFKRSKVLVGENTLAMVQKHYTEPRFFRILGENGKFTEFIINQMQQSGDMLNNPATQIINDITVGKYAADIDDAPLSATFLNAQYEEMMTLLEKMGPALGPSLPMFADLIIDASTMPNKREWIDRFKQLMGAQQAAQQGAPPGDPNAPPPPGGQPQMPPPGAQQPQPQPVG